MFILKRQVIVVTRQNENSNIIWLRLKFFCKVLSEYLVYVYYSLGNSVF